MPGSAKRPSAPLFGFSVRSRCFHRHCSVRVCPAEPLAYECGSRLGRLGPRRGFRGIAALPAQAVKREREIRILRERVRAQEARLPHGFRAIRAQCSEDHGDAVHDIVRAPVEVESAQVFERLEARHRRALVADVDASRHSSNLRIGERPHELRESVRLRLRVGVEHDEKLMPCEPHGVVERLGLAAVCLANDSYARVLHRFRGTERVVLRTIVDDEDLEGRRIVAGEKRAQSGCDDLFFVVRRDENAKRRRELSAAGLSRAVCGSSRRSR